ncbi:MAG: carboxypeptidase-like regulatory domain-containing protein, partial [Tannerellaceae bacterium]|nr:carboxypeptidase-like regulatory domain-containing protein [Tannerellaceae bacterium]
MKGGRLILLVMLIFSFVSVSAQNQRQRRVEVKGTIVEEGTGVPVEQATVRLLSLKDSTLVGGVASGRNGNFSLKNMPAGNYLLHVSFIGFEPLYQPLQITGATDPVDLGTLKLNDGAMLLDDAVVMGKAPEVIVRNDTIEYNADSYKVTEGSMLEDLLKKMPGVEIDDEGNVTVNGKSVQKMLVDG